MVVVAAVSFAAVFGLLFAIDDPKEAVAVLFVVPIALCALAHGARGGSAGAAVAAVLLVIWVAADGHHLGVFGWCSRLIAFAVIGILVGRFEDLARELERRRLGERYAAEVHDGVVQHLVVARYRMQAGEVTEASTSVDEALDAAKRIISERMGDVRPGDLRLEWHERDS